MVIHDPAVSLRETIFSRCEIHRLADENEAKFARFRKRLNRTRVVVAKIVRNDRTSGDRRPILCRSTHKQRGNNYLLWMRSCVVRLRSAVVEGIPDKYASALRQKGPSPESLRLDQGWQGGPFDKLPSTSSGRADEDHRRADLSLANAVSAGLDDDERGLQLLLGIERQGTGEFGVH
jgi:hypothetical protein